MQPVENKISFGMESMARGYLEQVLQELQAGAEFRLLIPVPVLARILGVNITRAYQLTKIEGFPCLKIGRKILVPVVPLLAWLESQAVMPLNEQPAADLPGRTRR